MQQADIDRRLCMSASGPIVDIAKSKFQRARSLFFWNVAGEQAVSFIWSRQHNTANSRKNAVALPNQPRQTSNEKYCCKWKRFGRSSRKTLRHEQPRAKLVDLVLQTLTTIRIGLVSLIRIGLVSLCQGQPCARHLQENSTLLLILSGLSYIQTLCGEATVLVRLTHRNRSPDFSAAFFCNAENSRRFPSLGSNSQVVWHVTAELQCNGHPLPIDDHNVLDSRQRPTEPARPQLSRVVT